MQKSDAQPETETSVLSLAKLRQGLEAGAEELFQLIQDPDPQFLAALLKNPQLDENHLLALLKRHDLSPSLLNRIHQLTRNKSNRRLQLALISNPATSNALVRALLPQLRLFELVDLCLLPTASADQKMAAERTILQRLPTTPLGSKITLARRGNSAVVAELLQGGHPQVFNVCLSNPRLQEAALHRFLRGPTATAETISMIARHDRWKQRPNLQLAILKNARTPDIWFTLWLPRLKLPLLQQLRNSLHSKPHKKALINRELSKRAGEIGKSHP
jgi:hypothetical protein